MSSGSSTPNPNHSSPTEWLSRVRAVQVTRIEPAQREEILRKAEQQRTANHLSLQSMVIGQRAEEAVYLTRRANTCKSMAEREDAKEKMCKRGAAYSAAWNDSAMLQQHVAQSRWEDARSRRVEAREEEHADDAEDEEEDALPPPPSAFAAGAHQPAISMQLAPAESAAADSSSLLNSLRHEPSSDAECADKFATYETFSDAVTGLRQQLDQVAAAAIQTLPQGEPARSVGSEMKALDCIENTAIYDQSRNWFLYEMAIKTVQNCGKIRALSEKITAKVQFAARHVQEECPICMEKFTTSSSGQQQQGEGRDDQQRPQVVPRMLGCCHTVCEDCWTNWVAVRHGTAAFCPLCRHQDFVEFIVRGQ